MLVFLCIGVQDGVVAQQSVVSGVRAQVHVGHAAQSSGYLEPHWEEHSAAFVFSKRLSFIQRQSFLSFLPPFHSPLCFFFLSFHCYHSVTGAWMSLCVGAHGWVAGIASHGSVLLSRGWLITVKAPGHPGHPPSTQLDAVVKDHQKISIIFPPLSWC